MNFVILAQYDNYVPAHLARGRLEEEGIRCWLQDENTVTTMPVWSHAIGGIKLMVVEAQAERARQILSDTNEAYKASIPCPACGSQNTEAINTPRKPVNLFTAIVSSLFGGYAVSVEKVQHCFDCGKEYVV